jgi:diguanylate cyclase (GGDEF)-like protein
VRSWSGPGSCGESPAGTPGIVYGACIDVSGQVSDRQLRERLSATDPVTGLDNRISFDRRLGGMLRSRSGRPASDVTLILLDLDRFALVNEGLGNHVGDRLLVEVARRLVGVVPEGSLTARMGSDEFAVVPPAGIPEADVRRLAIRVAEALRSPYVLPETGELLVCPASLGLAISGRRRVTSSDLLREADIALNGAKDSGRDRYLVFDDDLRAGTEVRRAAEQRLRQAIEHDRMTLLYQPIVDFSNGRTVGAEMLLRLTDAEAGDRLLPPDLFMDIAEQTGVVVELDSWVVDQAIARLAAWRDRPDRPWLAVNVSAASMQHGLIARRLVEAVKRGELSRDAIRIELREHSFAGALPSAEAALKHLLSGGIRVGVDDFGTGYSALAYLPNYDLDFIKIDRSFVCSVGEDRRGDAVIQAMVDVAHARGMRVIAEGVESTRQARRLRELGCDFAQGFHFGRPGEAARIVRG